MKQRQINIRFIFQHEFPNFQVDVYALVLDNGGSALGAAIMAASLALANANVPMFGIVTTVTAVSRMIIHIEDLSDLLIM